MDPSEQPVSDDTSIDRSSHPLEHEWIFYYQKPTQGKSWELPKPVYKFSTVEEFWMYF